MSGHKRGETCIYCLTPYKKLTRDHVFPESWYPQSTPAEIAKWTVPACERCNNLYSKIESEVLLRLGLCLDPSALASGGILDTVKNTIDPSRGKNPKDQLARLRVRQRLLSEMTVSSSPPTKGILPGFGPISNQRYDHYTAVYMEPDGMKQLAEKFIRGAAYVLERNIIYPDYEITVTYPREDPVALTEVSEILTWCDEIRTLGPGFEIRHAVPHDDRRAGIYFIKIWQKWSIFGIILRRDDG